MVERQENGRQTLLAEVLSENFMSSSWVQTILYLNRHFLVSFLAREFTPGY